jgi:molecular chaperone DnaK
LDAVSEKLEQASTHAGQSTDPEVIKKAHEDVLEAKRVMAQVRKDHLSEVRTIELGRALDFAEKMKPLAKPAEAAALDNATRAAKRDLPQRDGRFEQSLEVIWSIVRPILFRQDWFVLDLFRWLCERPNLFPDKAQFEQHVAVGNQAVKADDMERLREVVTAMQQVRLFFPADEDFVLSEVNIRLT